jgi:hypothetical protein
MLMHAAADHDEIPPCRIAHIQILLPYLLASLVSTDGGHPYAYTHA